MQFDKKLEELTLNEVMTLHFDQGATSSTTDYRIESTLRVILKETRHCLNFDRAKQMMPCIGSFAILDQVGNTYSRTGVAAYPNANASGIKKALYYFGEFGANDAATKTLYALRNALVHNSSLLNERNGVYHSFKYDDTIPNVVVTPAQAWDGRAATLNDNTTSVINPRRLVDLVTAIVTDLNNYLQAGTLQTTLTIPGILSNYLLLHKK